MLNPDHTELDALPENYGQPIAKQESIFKKRSSIFYYFFEIFKSLDSDDLISIRFLLHGHKDNAIKNKVQTNIVFYDSMALTQFFQDLVPDEEQLKTLLKQLMFLIKRYDLLNDHFKICQHKFNEELHCFDPIWLKLFELTENIEDNKVEKLKDHLGIKKENLKYIEDVIIEWYFSTNEPLAIKLDDLSSKLRLIGEHEIASKFQGDCSLNSDFYAMDKVPCGIAVIFNFENFDDDYIKDRVGTELDKNALKEVWEQFGFIVETHDNLTSREVKEELKFYAQQDFSKFNCFICCVLSHGSKGLFYTKEKGGIIKISDMKNMFSSKCVPSLYDKPRIFILQACQNEPSPAENLIKSQNVVEDGLGNLKHEMSDMLECGATVEGYVSFRDIKNGSWYIKTLTSLLKRFNEKKDFESILTNVNREVAAMNVTVNGKILHQTPYKYSSLGRSLMFKKIQTS